MAQTLALSARTVGTIRLETLGLNYQEVKHWRGAPPGPRADPAEQHLIYSTPFAGLWLLVPQILEAGLVQAAQHAQVLGRTRVQATQIVLTLLAWATLNFQRLMHLDDHRHFADLGLALFTGALRLWQSLTRCG